MLHFSALAVSTGRPCHNFEIAGIGIECPMYSWLADAHTTKVQLIPLEHDQSQQTNSNLCKIIGKLFKITIKINATKLTETIVLAGLRWIPRAVF